MNLFLEACCTSLEEVRLAEAGGASRIELCEDLSCGGITPSTGLLRKALCGTRLPVNVLVRPAMPSVRPGLPFDDPSQYVYSAENAELMLAQIASCREAGAEGIVAGALLPDGSIDLELTKRIVDAAGPLPVTFHKAFDACSRPFEALEQIISAGCARILTSGCAPTALEGLPLLAELVRASAGRIIIMPGGSIRPSNIAQVAAVTRAPEYHASSAYFTK